MGRRRRRRPLASPTQPPLLTSPPPQVAGGDKQGLVRVHNRASVSLDYKTRFFHESQEGFSPHFPENDPPSEAERSLNAQPPPDLSKLAIGGSPAQSTSPQGSPWSSEGSHAALRAGLPQTSRDLRRRMTADSGAPSRTASPDILAMLGPGGGGSITRVDSEELVRAMTATAESGGGGGGGAEGEGEGGADEPFDDVALAYSLTGRTVRARARQQPAAWTNGGGGVAPSRRAPPTPTPSRAA